MTPPTADAEVAAPKPVAAPAAPAKPRPGPASRAPNPLPQRLPWPPPRLANGTVHIAISPWGQVEVERHAGRHHAAADATGAAAGQHTITVRNDDFPPYTQRVQVDAERPVTVKHRFGS